LVAVTVTVFAGAEYVAVGRSSDPTFVVIIASSFVQQSSSSSRSLQHQVPGLRKSGGILLFEIMEGKKKIKSHFRGAFSLGTHD
jgi:hypothetical protein